MDILLSFFLLIWGACFSLYVIIMKIHLVTLGHRLFSSAIFPSPPHLRCHSSSRDIIFLIQAVLECKLLACIHNDFYKN